MTLLSIIQDAAIRCGVKNTPSEIPQAIGSTDPIVQQLVAFSRDVGEDCQNAGVEWRELKIQGQITTDGVSSLFQVPTDFVRLMSTDRYPFGRLVSETNPAIPFNGPVNDQYLQELRAYPGSPAWPVWRLIGNTLEIWPVRASGEIINLWYISNAWILGQDALTRKSNWTEDTDTSLIPESVIMRGIIWRWKASKGLDYAEAMRDFELSLERASTQDGAGRTVHMSSKMKGPLDNWWPGTITI